ncbi:MAG: carboxypeptidase-like regulatory domain-containing protein [Terracidiphilus sp.]|jgi:tetratricopeptide (TPR) repeat protein
MKRNISLWLGLLAFALLPSLAQAPAPTGKIHGHVTNPTGASQTTGSVSLSTDKGITSKFTFPVNSAGDYAGDATPGTYTVVYRQPDTPPDKMVDSFDGIKIIAGQDVLQDIDMSRKAFTDKLPPDQQKQLEDLKKKNAEALQANALIKNLNADLKVVTQDFKDADTARATAVQTLGATASKTDLDAKETEIKQAKLTEVETLMLKDTQAKPDASVLWAQLALAELGLKKYDESEANYKKVLELEAASKKPNAQAQGAANAGLGEIYARTGKVPEANAAYDAAAKMNPPSAAVYLKNEAVIFYQEHNPDAQAAAADEAIKADPTLALAYYLKGNGLVAKTTADPKTNKLIAPPGCLEAYQKYLELAPTGTYAGEVKDILAGFNQKVDTSYKAPKATKKPN